MLTKFTKPANNDTVVVGTDKKNDHYNNNKNLTSSDIRVAMDLPISWYLLWFPMGPSNINTNLVGTGTSVKSRRMMGCRSRTKPTTGWFRKSTSPTRMLAASAPGGIFFMKCRLWKHQKLWLQQSIRIQLLTFCLTKMILSFI